MADDDTQVIKPEPELDGSPAPFGEMNLIDQLRADQRELSESPEVFIPVAGYERTGLQVKYHLPDSGKELEVITRRVFREHKDVFSRNLYTSIDIMINLCAGLYVQPPEVDQPVQLDPQLTGEPVCFDQRLASILGFDENSVTPRGLVKRVFGDNEMAIIAHAQALDRWMRNTKSEVSIDFGGQVGEF